MFINNLECFCLGVRNGDRGIYIFGYIYRYVFFFF